MPDQNTYSDTVGNLDRLRREQIAIKKQEAEPKHSEMKVGKVTVPITIPGQDPTRISDEEKQYATLLMVAQAAQKSLAEAKAKYKDLLKSGEDIHESPEADKIADQARRARGRLEYFQSIADDIGKGADFKALTGPKYEALASELRPLEMRKKE